MNILSDIITYIRRIIKSPSDAVISDNLLIDYINRFWINDVDARIQLFDLKKKYQFQTTPGVDRYNMPLYDLQTEPGNQTIGMYPVYQGFIGPCYVNGVAVPFFTQRELFFSTFPNIVQWSGQLAIGNGTSGPYTLQFPIAPGNAVPVNPPVQSLIRGHVDIQGIINTGNNVDPPLEAGELDLTIPTTSVESAVYFTTTNPLGANMIVCDSGQFLDSNVNYGLLMSPGNAPFGNTALPNGGALANTYTTVQNTINYLTGIATDVYFPSTVPDGVVISGQCYYFQAGLPRGILFHNNVITLRSPPSQQWLVELDAYLSPAAFLSTADPVAFGYISEYIARGAARKILSDTGDVEQFNFYEPLFQEQEMLVWKRAQRQFASTRNQTIYSGGLYPGYGRGIGSSFNGF